MIASKIKPSANRLLVEVESFKQDSTVGGIYIPASEGEERYRVIAIGEAKKDGDPCPCKEGDYVLIPEFGGSKLKIGTQNYLFLRFDEILGVAND